MLLAEVMPSLSDTGMYNGIYAMGISLALAQISAEYCLDKHSIGGINPCADQARQRFSHYLVLADNTFCLVIAVEDGKPLHLLLEIVTDKALS